MRGASRASGRAATPGGASNPFDSLQPAAMLAMVRGGADPMATAAFQQRDDQGQSFAATGGSGGGAMAAATALAARSPAEAEERALQLAADGIWPEALALREALLTAAQRRHGDPSVEADRQKVLLAEALLETVRGAPAATADFAAARSAEGKRDEKGQGRRREKPPPLPTCVSDGLPLLDRLSFAERILAPAVTLPATQRDAGVAELRGRLLATHVQVLHRTGKSRAAVPVLTQCIAMLQRAARLRSQQTGGVDCSLELAHAHLTRCALQSRAHHHVAALQASHTALAIVLALEQERWGEENGVDPPPPSGPVLDDGLRGADGGPAEAAADAAGRDAAGGSLSRISRIDRDDHPDATGALAAGRGAGRADASGHFTQRESIARSGHRASSPAGAAAPDDMMLATPPTLPEREAAAARADDTASQLPPVRGASGGGGGGGGGSLPPRTKIYYGAVQAACYHNLAAEQEHLGLFELALESYQTGYELGVLALAPDHPLTARLRSSFGELFASVNYRHFAAAAAADGKGDSRGDGPSGAAGLAPGAGDVALAQLNESYRRSQRHQAQLLLDRRKQERLLATETTADGCVVPTHRWDNGWDTYQSANEKAGRSTQNGAASPLPGGSRAATPSAGGGGGGGVFGGGYAAGMASAMLRSRNREVMHHQRVQLMQAAGTYEPGAPRAATPAGGMRAVAVATGHSSGGSGGKARPAAVAKRAWTTLKVPDSQPRWRI